MPKRFLIAALLLCLPVSAQTVQPILQPYQVYVDSSGNPCAGCQLYSYQAGTTTPQPTYTDASGTSTNTNPIILDPSGGAHIWMGATSYKFVMVDTSGTTLWTVDNVLAPLPGDAGPFLPLAGGTLTGNLTVDGDITATGKLTVPVINGTRQNSYRGYPTVQDFGAKGDGQNNQVGAATSGSTTYTITGSPAFAAGDVGKMIGIVGASSSGTILITTIANYISPTQVVLGGTPTASCSPCNTFWGTDNTSAFNAATISTGSTPTAFTNQPGGIYIRVPAGVYLLSGTSSIFVRGGEFLVGDGQTSSQVFSLASGAIPLIQLGTNASGTPDNSGLATGIYGLMLNMPIDAGTCDISVLNISGFVIEENTFESGGIGICINAGTTVGTIIGNRFDSNLFNGISGTGNGVSTDNTNRGVLIQGNTFFQQRFAGILLDGVTDYTITGNQFMFGHQFDIGDTNVGISDFRINISDNNFIASTSSFATNESHIIFQALTGGGLQDSIISNNAFALSRVSDIALDGSLLNNVTVTGNTFTQSSQISTPSSTQFAIRNDFGNVNVSSNNFNALVGGGIVADNISDITIANYNVCSGIFTGGVPTATNANACIVNNAGGFITARGNQVTGGNALAIASPMGRPDTSDNVSDWVADVYLNANVPSKTYNERTSYAAIIGGTFTSPSFYQGIQLGGAPAASGLSVVAGPPAPLDFYNSAAATGSRATQVTPDTNGNLITSNCADDFSACSSVDQPVTLGVLTEAGSGATITCLSSSCTNHHGTVLVTTGTGATFGNMLSATYTRATTHVLSCTAQAIENPNTSGSSTAPVWDQLMGGSSTTVHIFGTGSAAIASSTQYQISYVCE